MLTWRMLTWRAGLLTWRGRGRASVIFRMGFMVRRGGLLEGSTCHVEGLLRAAGPQNGPACGWRGGPQSADTSAPATQWHQSHQCHHLSGTTASVWLPVQQRPGWQRPGQPLLRGRGPHPPSRRRRRTARQDRERGHLWEASLGEGLDPIAWGDEGNL